MTAGLFGAFALGRVSSRDTTVPLKAIELFPGMGVRPRGRTSTSARNAARLSRTVSAASCGTGFSRRGQPGRRGPARQERALEGAGEAGRRPRPRLLRPLDAAGGGDGAAQEADRACWWSSSAPPRRSRQR